MNIEKLSIFSGFIALCAGCSAQGGDASGVGATSQPLAAAAPVWTIVETPNAGSEDNVLAAVSGSSPDDVWAVGQHAADADPNMTLSLALHFDGNAWSVVDTPNQDAEANALLGVTAQPGAAWAVGYHIGQDFLAHSLVERWDGSAWHVVHVPSVHETENLYAAASTSASDVWAVGSGRDDEGAFQTLALHFDGRAWSIVPTANPGSTGNVLYGVVALAGDNAWAVGQKLGDGGPDQALIEHWDGRRWSGVHAAERGGASTQLLAVTALGDDVRAVGDAQDGVQSLRTFAEVAERGSFRLQSTDNPSVRDDRLAGVVAVDDDDTWAVGGVLDATSGNVNPLILRGGEHQKWVQVASPDPSPDGASQLSAITLEGDDLWAVGTFDGPDAAQTLVLHRSK